MLKQNNRIAEDQKPLPPLLDEFRTALQDEIEVAKRNASSGAIPLSNGHKVGQQGSAFQYAFLIDSVLNTPDGAPGDLVVPGKTPMQVTIVSVEGLRVVISVEIDLGKFVPSARLQTNLAILMRKLIERIEDNAYAENPAGSRMLGKSPVSGSPKRPDEIPKLYESQMEALESALGRNLTVIWGPPGTGKTHTIGTIAEHLHKSARTVLIVSHTNIAVDQAIKHVAKELRKNQLEQGAIIRVGEIRDNSLLHKFPEITLKWQIERRSRELVELRDKLASQQQAFSNELDSLQQMVTVIEWIEEVKDDIESSSANLVVLHRQEKQLNSMKRTIAELESKHAQLLQLQENTSRILTLRKELEEYRDEESQLQKLLSLNTSECQDAIRRIHEQENRIKILKRIMPLREERATYPTPVEQKSILGKLSSDIVDIEEELKRIRLKYSDANDTLEYTRSIGPIQRIWKRLPRPEMQEIVVSNLSKKVVALDAELMAAKTAYGAARDKLGRILELDAELSKHETIGTLSEELAKLESTQSALQRLERGKAKIETNLASSVSKMTEIQSEEKRLASSFNGDARDVYADVCSQLQKLKDLQDSFQSLDSNTRVLRANISAVLYPLLIRLREWEMIPYTLPNNVEESLKSVREAHLKLTVQYESTDLSALRETISLLRSEIHRLAVEINDIDKRLTQVEREILMNASIIGATLTKTYLSDDIQARQFDTVILDEASMAPIPALWVAALLSGNNLIIVGDFKQLPPIVLSKNELTKKWLGRDIFEASGILEEEAWPDYFIQLKVQRRMLPKIAQIANLFYDGSLSNAPVPPNELNEFREWCNSDWPQDAPVVLVDTKSLNAWVTSVVKGGNSSRLNFLSATVSVDLAESLLRSDCPERIEGSPNRILIISPYSPHAKLVCLLLSERFQIQDGILAGTVHSFQGSEADVVIFDLVVDEPHWRVRLFNPLENDDIRRLLNVGLTRAKFRLFVVGDFSYCQRYGKKAFLGGELLPFLLQSFPLVDASDIVPDGLAARAAKAQMTVLGGEIEHDSERIVVTQVDFYRLLLTDLSKAKSRISIYSAFMTEDRLSFLLPHLQAASSRGVAVFVVTKAHSERSRSELAQIRKMEMQLSKIGVAVMHKIGMHEKLCFIDDDITWVGSLNALSFSNTQEIMERRKSRDVQEHYFRVLRLNELLEVHGKPQSKCPICGSEIVAAEGADDPYYWRCINDDCYTRSIDQPYPFDGTLTCGNCNSPVEFGYWGDKPHWRCTSNNRHHQRIFKSHLRLPKMAALVPESERPKVCKIFGIKTFSELRVSSGRTAAEANEQVTLLEDSE